MKKLLCFITTLLLAISMPMAVMADTELSRVVDDADILSDSEEKALAKKIDDVVNKYDCDVVAVTTGDLQGRTAQQYADDYYDQFGYGVGSGDDGVLFLISVNPNNLAISTYGKGMDAFTSYGIDYIFDEVKPDAKDGNFNKVLTRYVELAEKFLDQAESGKPYDSNNKIKTTMDYLKYEAIALGVSLVLAVVILLVMKSKMNTAIKATTAKEYVRQNSFDLREKSDIYMYSNVTKVKIESNNSGSGNGSHSSSSGRSHGGGSTSF